MKTYKEVNEVSVSGDGDSIEKKDFKNKSKAEKRKLLTWKQRKDASGRRKLT